MQSTHLSIPKLCEGSVEEAFKVPREIGRYSVDEQKNLHYDTSQMKYYIPRKDKRLHLDLNVGYKKAPREPFSSLNKFHTILEVIAHSHFDELDRVRFVATRGTIQNLLLMPYYGEDQEGYWMLCACRVRDVIYLTSIDSDTKLKREKETKEEEKKMSAWGYRFEAYMTADRPDGVPKPTSITHEDRKYRIVFTNKIGSYGLLMTAEVDAADESKFSRRSNGETSAYVELKTSKMKVNFLSSSNFKRYKSLRWWTQCVIVGIEDILCGMRDGKGIVHSIEPFKTKELPFMCQWTEIRYPTRQSRSSGRRVLLPNPPMPCSSTNASTNPENTTQWTETRYPTRQSRSSGRHVLLPNPPMPRSSTNASTNPALTTQALWNPKKCFNFCNNFLEYLTQTVADNSRIVYKFEYKFEYNGEPTVIVSSLQDPEERFQVIPQWYLEKLEEHEKRKPKKAKIAVDTN